MEDKITISMEEYKSLKDCELWQNCMESWGVDNWSGYDEAIQEYREESYEYNDK